MLNFYIFCIKSYRLLRVRLRFFDWKYDTKRVFTLFYHKILIIFLGWKEASEWDGMKNIPEVGDICKVKLSIFCTRLAVFLEKPVDQRLSINEFRYYFEFIDQSFVNIYYGILYKPTGIKRYSETIIK